MIFTFQVSTGQAWDIIAPVAHNFTGRGEAIEAAYAVSRHFGKTVRVVEISVGYVNEFLALSEDDQTSYVCRYSATYVQCGGSVGKVN